MTIDEAISTLMENICMSCAYDAECMGKCDIRGCDNRDAIKVIIGETEQHRWIPVTERLPEEEGYYLVTVFDDWRHISEICIEYWRGKRKDWSTSLEVIAWMPLPKPYEGSEEE